MKIKICGELQEMAEESSYKAAMKMLVAMIPKAKAIIKASKKAKKEKDMVCIICDKCGLALSSCDGQGWEVGRKCPSCRHFIKSGQGHFRVMTQGEKREYLTKKKENGAMRFNEKGELLFYPAWGYRKGAIPKKRTSSAYPRFRHGELIA